MNWLFGAHSLWSGYLAQPRYRREGLGPASSNVTDFVDSPWEASPSLRSRLGRRWGGQEGEGTGIGMKMRKDCFKK